MESTTETAPPVTTDLLADVEAFIRRFVVVSDDQLHVLALWTIHTHCLDAAAQTPYLTITSPVKQCGKSRLVEVVELLVRAPWLAITPSEAVLYRKITADTPTLLLDEIDTIFSPQQADRHEGVRACINAGHRRGATVPRCVGPRHEVRDFRVFCPKLLAGIGTLPATVADRSIPIRLERRTRDQTIERFYRRDVEPEAVALRDQVQAWAAEHGDALASARPNMPDALSDREQEGCECLVAIADLLGRGDQARRSLVALLTGDRLDNPEEVGQLLLRDLRTIFDEYHDRSGLPTGWLLELLGKVDESPWGTWYGRGFDGRDLGKLLKPYGVKATTVRADDAVSKGYRRDDLAPVWAKYLPAATSNPAVTPNV